ncbi:MAG: PH domain-containing protein [Candidatus Dojkabacteria bacterium]|jgi:hypothetical protein
MDKPKRNIPKKFQKSKKSFVDRVYLESQKSSFNNVSAFPKGISFYGKDSDEDIVLVVRAHWIAYLPDLFVILLVLLLPVLLLFLSGFYPLIGTQVLYIGMIILSIGVAFTLLLSTLLKWYYTVNIITDQRIVVIKMNNAFHHSYAETQLEKIEDMTHHHLGFLGTFFDVGDVEIDTAGHGVDFVLRMLPRPREMQDILNDLLEMKQKGDI